MRAACIALTAIVSLAGCAPGARVTPLEIVGAIPGLAATHVSAYRGDCSAPPAADDERVELTGVERLPAGDWAIAVEGRNGECEIIARGCTDARLPSDRDVTVTLVAVPREPACGPELLCEAGACVPCDEEACAAPVLETGYDFACAIDRDDDVFCWGNDDRGQLPGVTGAQIFPVGVPFLDDAAAFSFGNHNGCYVGSDTQLRCWGANDYGQTGRDSSTPQVDEPAIVDLSAPIDLVGCTKSFCCAQTAADELYCFGTYAPNPTGVATHEPRSIDVAPVTQLAGGAHFMCGLHRDATVSCWGRGDWPNELGEWGGRRVEIVPQILDEVVSIVAGEEHCCALRTDGTVWCWGLGDQGQLGLGDALEACPITGYPDRLCVATPRQVPDATDITMIAAGAYTTCVVDPAGITRCVGENDSGELGDGTTVSRDRLGAAVLELQSPQVLVGGGKYMCAAQRGDVYCWGSNANGRAGLGSATSSTAPRLMLSGR